MNNKKVKNTEEKAFHFKMPKSTWILIKKASLVHDCTMSEVVLNCVEKQRKKLDDQFEKFGEVPGNKESEE